MPLIGGQPNELLVDSERRQHRGLLYDLNEAMDRQPHVVCKSERIYSMGSQCTLAFIKYGLGSEISPW